MNITNLDNFDQLGELANESEWLLIDFWAQWCSPCKAFNPILEDYSQSHPEVAVVKVNVDEKRDIATKFGIRAIPTLIFLRRDQYLGQKMGARSLGDLESWVDSLKKEV